MDLVSIERQYKIRRFNITIIAIIFTLLLILVVHHFDYFAITKKHANCAEEYEKQCNELAIIEQERKQEQEEQENIVQIGVQSPETKLPELTQKGRDNISNIYSSERKRAFLTFDDGPSREISIPILDLLKTENIKVTFFVLGSRVELYPDIVKREYEEGHYIANHGYSHIYSQIYTNTQTVLDEYNKTNDAIKNALGEPNYNSHLFRFPGGSVGGKYKQIKKEAIALLDSNNIAHVDWNALTGDAEGKSTKEEEISYLKETIGEKNNVVILMHDAADKSATYEALPEIISYLREKGYEFCNFYDIIE